MQTQSPRFSRVNRSRVAGFVVTLLVAGTLVGSAIAQEATPVASPVAGGVPCTLLFGIVEGNACVLIVQGTSDVSPVDIYVDGTLLLAGLPFGILGDFVPVPAGEHQLQVTAPGGDPAQAVLERTISLEEGVAYEIAIAGPGADLDLLLHPINTNPTEVGSARVQVINAAPDAPAVDLAFTGGDVLVSNLGYLATSQEFNVPTGVYNLDLRPADTEDEVVVSLAGTFFAPSTAYTMYVIGQVGDGTIGGFLVPVALPPEEPAGTPAATPTA